MAVAFDAVSTSDRTGTSDPHTFTHTPSGTPRGILLAFAQDPATSSDIDTITYGGVSMSRVVDASDTADEPGMAEVWFLGSSIPTGAQTVQVDFVTASPTDDYLFLCVSVTASSDTEVVDSGIVEENQADPSVSLTYSSRTCLAVGALFREEERQRT